MGSICEEWTHINQTSQNSVVMGKAIVKQMEMLTLEGLYVLPV